MSATVERNSVNWRKHRRPEDGTELQIEMKKPRCYFYRLASESSKESEDENESIYSIQDRETDVVRDTSDTDSKSGSDTDIEEYELISLSGSDNEILGNSSSDSNDHHVILAAAIGAMCDSSIEWITDCEESDNSSMDDSVVIRLGFSTCVQCKSQNDNPLYRYCEKCFQDRKKLYPPRPRGFKKPKKKTLNPPVKLDTLRSCLSGLSSQDSGVGSSQECPSLDLDQIVVPDKHLKPGTSDISSKPDIISKENTGKDTERDLKRKRQASESSLSDYDIKKPKYTRNSILVAKRNSRPSSRNSEEKRSMTLARDTSSLDKKLSEKSLLLTGTLSDEKSFSQKSTDTLPLSQTSSDTSFSLITKDDILSQTSKDEKVSSQELTEILDLNQTSPETSLSLPSQTSERTLSLRSAQSKHLSSSQKSDFSSEVGTSTGSTAMSSESSSDLCIMCNSAPKDTIFLHTKIGHLCCCYKCAKRTLDTIKRCPICNRSVTKVVKIFQ